MGLSRTVQAISFAAFLVLLWFAAVPLVPYLPVDLFLRMDPLVFVLATAAGRSFILKLLPAVLLLGMTLLLGRFFCSMVCPLGTSLDISDRLIRGTGRRHASCPGSISALRPVKYLALAFMVFSALFGLSWAAFGSPLVIATRLYGLLVYPVASLAGDAGLNVVRPLVDRIGPAALAYAHIPFRAFSLQWVTAGIVAGMAACAVLTPRFWCRYLCPAGAILALASYRPLITRRRVSETCTSCGLCRTACPMDAIAEDPHRTDFSECIMCRTCSSVCPENAVAFSPGHGALPAGTVPLSRHRRALLLSALAGTCAALASLAGPRIVMGVTGPGRVMDPSLIRPPGSLPERGFLRVCVGCGECMKVCPTNTLQPAGLAAGLTGMFSPVMVPRRGPCDTTCAACGQVCPTGAIRDIGLEEKRHAKVGTALILRHACIAWESGKACLVCDEVCPYGAVSLRRVPDVDVAVPVVDESRCNGCGFCEHYCPVFPGSAIVVDPMGALRLKTGSYRDRSRELGYSFNPEGQVEQDRREPGAGEDNGLPPGFSH